MNECQRKPWVYGGKFSVSHGYESMRGDQWRSGEVRGSWRGSPIKHQTETWESELTELIQCTATPSIGSDITRVYISYYNGECSIFWPDQTVANAIIVLDHLFCLVCSQTSAPESILRVQGQFWNWQGRFLLQVKSRRLNPRPLARSCSSQYDLRSFLKCYRNFVAGLFQIIALCEGSEHVLWRINRVHLGNLKQPYEDMLWCKGRLAKLHKDGFRLKYATQYISCCVSHMQIFGTAKEDRWKLQAWYQWWTVGACKLNISTKRTTLKEAFLFLRKSLLR